MKTPYFDSLFDDFGIWQHTDGIKPILAEGYALDDATRGLLLCLALNKTEKANVLFDYIVSSRHNKSFYGFSTDKHEFITFPASEDAVGQIVWSLGYSISVSHKSTDAKKIIASMKPGLIKMKSLRGPVYALLGSIYIDKYLAKVLYNKISKRFNGLDKSWFWPEDTLTYGNGIIPYAILRYALIFNDKKAEELGKNILKFLEKACTHNRIRGPIGNDGWFKKSDLTPAIYSQQPIDTAYMIWAWLALYQISGKSIDLNNAKKRMQWFEGQNVANSIMYDTKTLKAFDGIDPINPKDAKNKGINRHSGAETNICFLLSRWMLQNTKTI